MILRVTDENFDCNIGLVLVIESLIHMWKYGLL